MLGGFSLSASLLLLQLALGSVSSADDAKYGARVKSPWKLKQSIYGLGRRLLAFNGSWQTGKPPKISTDKELS